MTSPGQCRGRRLVVGDSRRAVASHTCRETMVGRHQRQAGSPRRPRQWMSSAAPREAGAISQRVRSHFCAISYQCSSTRTPYLGKIFRPWHPHPLINTSQASPHSSVKPVHGGGTTAALRRLVRGHISLASIPSTGLTATQPCLDMSFCSNTTNQ